MANDFYRHCGGPYCDAQRRHRMMVVGRTLKGLDHAVSVLPRPVPLGHAGLGRAGRPGLAQRWGDDLQWGSPLAEVEGLLAAAEGERDAAHEELLVDVDGVVDAARCSLRG